MDISMVTSGVVGTLAVGAGFLVVGKFGPGLVVNKLHEGFEQLKDSAWVRDAAHPKRAKALMALAELLEDEIPAPGAGQAFYDAAGAQAAGLARVGSAAQWAKVLRQFGDAVDTELADDIKEIAASTPPSP